MISGLVRRSLGPALVTAVCCFGPVGTVAAPVGADPPASAAETAAMHEQSLARIEDRMRALKDALANREQYRDALYAELERTERDIAALALAGHQLSAMVTEQRKALDDLVRRRADAAVRLADARAALAELLRSAYAMGRGDQLRLLLDQEDPARSGRIFGYYRALGRLRADRIRDVGRQAAELEHLSAEAEAETERLERLAQRQDETRGRLEAARAVRAAIVDGLDTAIAGDRREVTALDADAEALRSLIEQLRRKAQIEAEVTVTQETIAARRGRLDWPVADARVLRGFHAGGGLGDAHADGVMLAAADGSEVHAVHHGRVVYADWLRGFGLLLVIDHGDGYMTLYGNNETLLKEVGEWVDAGDVIALSGSGRRGLYFAIRRHGKPLDPGDWCRRNAG
jgi:septal ring factor EnvC (AmiA/AmiB activator)